MVQLGYLIRDTNSASAFEQHCYFPLHNIWIFVINSEYIKQSEQPVQNHWKPNIVREVGVLQTSCQKATTSKCLDRAVWSALKRVFLISWSCLATSKKNYPKMSKWCQYNTRWSWSAFNFSPSLMILPLNYLKVYFKFVFRWYQWDRY